MSDTETRIDPAASHPGLAVAVLVPCFNEAQTIGKVVADFRAALPRATIYVYDNASTDGTAQAARAAGARVRSESQRGKGNVVRRMFADIDADVYLLVDGDDTYDAGAARGMVDRLIDRHLDVVAGARSAGDGTAYRRGHRFGNRLLSSIVALIFGNRFRDMLTGYRALSRRFVKSFPALTSGFEIETELTIHALALRMPVAELPTAYRERPSGSSSKLRTVNDGLRISRTILILLKEERPLAFFTTIFVVLALTSVVLAWPLLVTYLETGLVPRFPTAILASAMMLLAFLSQACGLILDTVTRGRRELKRMHYLAINAPEATDKPPRS
jgi:glycosyltransferase involved in cell wall biosynthesis